MSEYVVTQMGPVGPRSQKLAKWYLGDWKLFGMTCPQWHMTNADAHIFTNKREAQKVARIVDGEVQTI